MKIIIITTGVQSIFGFRRSWIYSVTRAGHVVTVFVNDWSIEAANKAKNDLEISLRPWPINRTGLNPFSDVYACWTLWRVLWRLRPDVTLSTFAKPVIWGGIGSRLAKVPINVGMLEGLGYAFTPHPDGAEPYKQRLLRWMQVLLYRLAIPRLTRIIFLNPDDPVDLLQAHRIRATDVQVLGGIGVDLARYVATPPPVASMSADSDHAVTFLFVGRLLAEKGIHDYVTAAKQVKAYYPQARFIVLGGLDEGNPGGLKKRELDTLIADNVIEYPGFVTNMPEWLARADVFVLPSYREGVPASTQEAMAVGRAVLTTDVPGCRETVMDGVNGFLVPPWSPDRLAEKMLYLIEHPELIVTMGKASRKIAEEKFDAAKVNRRLCTLLGILDVAADDRQAPHA